MENKSIAVFRSNQHWVYPKNQFDLSTAAKIWHDTSEVFDIETKILAFLGLTGNFEPCVTLGRFAKRPCDA
jgi:hypothetical protein